MEWYSILVMLLEGLIPLFVAVVGAILLKWAKDRGLTEDLRGYLQDAFNVLAKAVLDTNQTYVYALKKANGALTDEEQAMARAKTIAIFNVMLTDEMEIAIEAMYGSVDQWLEIYLESTVAEVHS